jgi:putative transcriptional regulator
MYAIDLYTLLAYMSRNGYPRRTRKLQRRGNCRLQEDDNRDFAVLATEKAMSKAADRIVQGLREAAAHARGEQVPGLKLHVPRKVDVSAIRRRTGLSQAAFSRRIGVSTGTLRNWEQGRRSPDGPARVLLAMLARNPRIVEEMLGN